jgi:hypothetical protein
MIRNKDGHVNATKLVKDINKQEGISKNLRDYFLSQKWN